MYSIGLSGGLGSGKSLAAKIFFEQGANILNADDIAKNLIKVKPELIAEIKEVFGEDCYYKGELQNAILAERAFKSPESIKKLNAISHPALKDHLEKYIQAFKLVSGVLVVEVAILFEAGFQDIFDTTLLVTADDNIRVERAVARGQISEESIRERMALQMSEDKKYKLSDYIIENNESEEELREKCVAFWDKIQLL